MMHCLIAPERVDHLLLLARHRGDQTTTSADCRH